MHGNSKAEKVGGFIQESVDLALGRMALDNPEQTDAIRKIRHALKIHVAYYASRHYRLLELQDIMDWEKPRKTET